ncbi:hypothetical protein [Peribacillus frigoritolerans]|uniref:hypothetical protein n=1 Tax=Peribacillus frigoritolerans TaxID=450367 RepID=UPI002280529A|nr:hypothetical protein [Peribacillus frigoritolerans]MCY8936387.1 hypothetical protein [Peribacillus frigoritolerans]
MKPYDSFNQQNDHNGNERNAHLRNMGNHFMEGAYRLENQMMDVRTPPGPPVRPMEGASRLGRRTEEDRLI